MIAEAILGNGERAHEYYAQINLITNNGMIEIYECEPYVYAQNILGDEHPQFGLGRNSWKTGTASWCYQAATQWILGIRQEFGGLRIDLCIPSYWDGFAMKRIYRNAWYEIEVQNPEGISSGVQSIYVHGELIGNCVPIFEDG